MSFTYHEPPDVAETIGLLDRFGEEAAVLAGGTAFMLFWKQGLIRPRQVIGLRRCAALRGIAVDGNRLWIGAMATHRQVERSPAVQRRLPALADGFGQIASIRIRNQATVGGNLVHADPAQDPPTLLVALGASVVIAGPQGDREQPLESFFLDYFTVALEPSSLVTGVRIPFPTPGTRVVYRKFLPRTVDDYATVSVAAAARQDADGRIEALRVTLGSVGATPIRARAVEQALVGSRVTSGALADAAALVRDEVDPIDDARGSAHYKREMSRVWTMRALAEVVT
jgi:carbon-monoxide dehydrogenase medium subunit